MAQASNLAAATAAAAAVPDPEIIERIENAGLYAAVANTKWIVDRLLATGFARKVKLAPKDLGVNQYNRGTYGTNEESCQNLGADILEVGFDEDAVVAPICVEDDPASSIEAYNIALVKGSTMLAPVAPGSIVAGTITNSHLVQFLRAVRAGVPTKHSALAVDGHLSLAHIAAKDPAMGAAVEHGWTWTMLSHKCVALYGKRLIDMLSSAKNIVLARAETDVECLLKIHNQACEYKLSGQDIDWNTITQNILRTKPSCASALPFLVKFIKNFGGGVDSPFMKDFAIFHRKYAANERHLSESFWDALSNLVLKEKKHHHDTKAPLLRFAIMKAEFTCPPAKVSRGECRFIIQSDLAGLSKKKLDDAIRAESILSKARELAIAANVSADEVCGVFGRLDTRLVRVLLGKQKGQSMEYDSMEQVACHFFDEFASLAPTSKVANPWEEHRGQAASSSSCEQKKATIDAAEADMQTYTAAGAYVPVDPKTVLAKHGFAVEAVVVSKKHLERKFTVVALTDPVVVQPVVRKTDTTQGEEHQPGEAEKPVEVPLMQFLTTWVLYEETNFPIDGVHHVSNNVSFQINATKSAIFLALSGLAVNLKQPDCRLQAKPTKKVFALGSHERSTISLLPLTTNISVVMKGVGDAPSTGIALGHLCDAIPAASFYLSPPQMSHEADKKTLNVPFWAIRACADEKIVNITPGEKVCATISIKADPKSKSCVYKEIEIPIFTNSRDVVTGDELVSLKESKETSEAGTSDKGSSSTAKAAASKAVAKGVKRQRR